MQTISLRPPQEQDGLSSLAEAISPLKRTSSPSKTRKFSVLLWATFSLLELDIKTTLITSVADLDPYVFGPP